MAPILTSFSRSVVSDQYSASYDSVNVRFGSISDMQQSPRERPLPGAKQTYLGQPRVGRRVYGKELFSVQTDAMAGTRSASGWKTAFSGGFSVYLNNMRTSSVRCDSDFRTIASRDPGPRIYDIR